MCKLKFLLTSTRIKLVVFFRPLFWLVTQSREAKKRPRRRSHASEAWDLEHRDVFSVRFFFYVHVFCGIPFNAKQTSYWKRLKFVPSCFFNFWSTTESQMKTATTMAPNKRLYMHARFYSFAHLSAFVRKKKYENVIIRSSRFWEHKHLTELHQIQNARVQSSN